MTRTFLKKKISLKKNVYGQKQRSKQTQAVPKETQQISEFTQQPIIFHKRQKQGYTRLFAVNPCVYAEITEEPVCIRDCELKTHIQEERCMNIKEKIQAETNFTPIRHYQANMPPDPTQKQRTKRNSKSLNPDRNPQRTTTRNSPAESLILLCREIPMAWGTTMDNLTPEINHFLYSRETKYLTLKDLDSYLILDG